MTDSRLYAAEVVLRHVNALASQIDGARAAKDIEFVHRMRVASRRLSNAMRLFADLLPGSAVKRWKKGIRRVTRSLSVARDLDVQIVFVKEVLTALAHDDIHRCRPGLACLLLRLTQQRERAQQKVIVAMDRLEAGGLLDRMRQTLCEFICRARSVKVDSDKHDLRGRGRADIQQRLEALIKYEPYVDKQGAVEELHRMRLAAKRFRYTLEAYCPVFHNRLKAQIKIVRRIQTLLGDLHDCSVWVKYLPRFMEEEGQRYERFFGHQRGLDDVACGIEYLANDRRNRQVALLEQFRLLWRDTRAQRRWEQLQTILDNGKDGVA